jgi:multiple sugar transport system permease protein
MTNAFEQVGPSSPVLESIRVDKVHPRAKLWGKIRAAIAIAIAVIMLIPVAWILRTAFIPINEVTSIPPKILFSPTLEGMIYLLTDDRILSQEETAAKKAAPNIGWVEQIMLAGGREITGPSAYARQLLNSVIIAGTSTLLSVALGLLAAYAFSRFDVPGKGDLMFFILSTRMLPPVVVTIPIFLMYRALGLNDTLIGMILLYTVFNLSFSVWLLKGFIDEIPREYEDAAMVDGYTRFQAFIRIVLPQSLTGIAATTVFCLIFAWNEYAFALMLTSQNARTAPPAIPSILGSGGIEWNTIASAVLLFLIPVVIVTFALRDYLLRGVTFGAIRK